VRGIPFSVAVMFALLSTATGCPVIVKVPVFDPAAIGTGETTEATVGSSA
jgi:hypothetical protein